MNKEKFLRYFKKKENTSENNEDARITNVVTSVTKDITNAELSFAVGEIKKLHNRPEQYQKKILENLKIEVEKHESIFGACFAIKKFSLKYPKHRFNRTTVQTGRINLRGDVIVIEHQLIIGGINLRGDVMVMLI